MADKYIQLQSADGVDNLFPIGILDLLWENSSPTSNFSAQTILNGQISDYNFFLIEFKGSTGATSNHLFQVVAKTSSTQRLISAYDYILVRVINSITNNGIAFSNGAQIIPYGTVNTADNKYVIPLAVYGIRLSIKDDR